jgi:hypothetical protein
MAIVTSLFVVPLLLGMLQTSRLCMVAQLLTNAAREGCRVAAKNGNVSSDVTARVNATLSASGISSGAVTTTCSPTAIESTHLGDAITVNVSVSFSSVSWLSYTYLFPSSTRISGSATMASERP